MIKEYNISECNSILKTVARILDCPEGINITDYARLIRSELEFHRLNKNLSVTPPVDCNYGYYKE